MARDTTKSREPRVNPQVRLAQAKRFAEGALEHYNRRKKVRYAIYSLDLENNIHIALCILDW